MLLPQQPRFPHLDLTRRNVHKNAMPGAGTDKTKNWIETPAPFVVLVEPQLGENIGAAARVMANFGLSRLRLVAPRQGWPNGKAKIMASGADRVLDNAQLFKTAADAVADCTFVLATTARAHDQAKPVLAPQEAARQMTERVARGENVAILFGRERIGLVNEEVALADATVTFPVNPAFASLNLAQAVSIMGYEWFKAAGGGLPFVAPEKSAPARKQQIGAFLSNLEKALDDVEFFRPPEKRATMLINLKNIFARMQPSQQDMQTLSGIVTALADGSKGPARGGILDGEEAARLRALIAEGGHFHVSSERTPARGLAKLLRRNPTEGERALWDALVRDRRFAGLGFKRQTPIGPVVADIVSFPLRAVIAIVPQTESEVAAQARATQRRWLSEHNYTILEAREEEIAADLAGVLDRLAGAIAPLSGVSRSS
jgi:tRNA/rRNA methyltransferase